MLTFHFISIFPEAFSSYLGESILKRAQAKSFLRFDFVDPRKFATGRHKKVDDRPFGGGPGMVMMPEPISKAVRSITRRVPRGGRVRVILLSPRGKTFTQADARRLAKYRHLAFICGRYEGVDERVAEQVAAEVISIGAFVLSGGELAALVIAEAVARQVPGVLGKQESLEDARGSHPAYTRPPVWKPAGSRGKGFAVPPVLLSGNHKKIAEWRRAHGKTGRT